MCDSMWEGERNGLNQDLNLRPPQISIALCSSHYFLPAHFPRSSDVFAEMFPPRLQHFQAKCCCHFMDSCLCHQLLVAGLRLWDKAFDLAPTWRKFTAGCCFDIKLSNHSRFKGYFPPCRTFCDSVIQLCRLRTTQRQINGLLYKQGECLSGPVDSMLLEE